MELNLKQNNSDTVSPREESTTTDPSMRFAVLTTCNEAGWQQYGRRMIETFDQFWPADVPLYLYAEDFDPDHRRPVVRRLPAWLTEFKARHGDDPSAHGLINGSYHMRQDCVRFSHKVAAVTNAA